MARFLNGDIDDMITYVKIKYRIISTGPQLNSLFECLKNQIHDYYFA